jgi:hypothetical protein
LLRAETALLLAEHRIAPDQRVILKTTVGNRPVESRRAVNLPRGARFAAH